MEDAAYTRLLRSYYLRELPIPSDLAETTRLVRAVTRREKEAVTHVLNEFFELREDGFHNARADKEIQQYQAQASTNRRIARERIVARSVDEASTKGTPNQEPLTKNQEPVVNLKSKERKTARARETPLPIDFKISEQVETWAKSKGFANLPSYLEFFIGRMKANGKTYTDWDQAFMNCIREDWPEFRENGNGGNGSGNHEQWPSCVRCGGSTAGGFAHTFEGRVCSICRSTE